MIITNWNSEKYFSIFFFFILLQSCSVSQSNYPHRVMTIQEKNAILIRMTDYESAIHLADSLHQDYKNSRFDLATKESGSYSDGLSFILSLYETAKKLTTNTTYATQQINKIEKQLENQLVIEKDALYLQIINKAEENYNAGNYEEANELYKRALKFRPNDREAAKRLKEIEQTSTISLPSQFRDLRDFPAIAKEENIDSLISGMIKEDCVYESAIGFAGAYTETYAYFERLCELSSDKEMFELVKHSNANVRLYALKGLIAKESSYTSKAKLLLNTDEEMVCIFSGCSMMEQKMKDVYIVNNEE